MKKINNNKKKKKIMKKTIFFIICDILALACFIMMYGPINTVRNRFVTTAMNTMDHQWYARIFYSEEKISKIMSSNYFITLNEDANLDDITINTEEKDNYLDEYDKEILTRDEGNDLYKVIDLKVGASNAYLVAIYDPTKIHLISAQKFNVGGYGERIITMCERYGGIVCINGGGFVDNGLGSDIPLGYVIQNGEITWGSGDSKTSKANIIGITKEGKLKLMSNATGQEALDAGIMDALSFDPFLIVNGKAMEIVGDPWGSSPRIAIAQRKDGVMLFLAIDGENYIDGATLQDMIDVLLKYKAYNAANLDGGTSSSLVIDGKLYNKPPAAAAKTNGRYVVTGWGLIP